MAIYCRISYEATVKDLLMTLASLVMNPFDIELQTRVANLFHQKQVVDNYATYGAQLKAYLHWLEVGDQASKEFFNVLRAHHTMVGIQHI